MRAAGLRCVPCTKYCPMLCSRSYTLDDPRLSDKHDLLWPQPWPLEDGRHLEVCQCMLSSSLRQLLASALAIQHSTWPGPYTSSEAPSSSERETGCCQFWIRITLQSRGEMGLSSSVNHDTTNRFDGKDGVN